MLVCLNNNQHSLTNCSFFFFHFMLVSYSCTRKPSGWFFGGYGSFLRSKLHLHFLQPSLVIFAWKELIKKSFLLPFFHASSNRNREGQSVDCSSKTHFNSLFCLIISWKFNLLLHFSRSKLLARNDWCINGQTLTYGVAKDMPQDHLIRCKLILPKPMACIQLCSSFYSTAVVTPWSSHLHAQYTCTVNHPRKVNVNCDAFMPRLNPLSSVHDLQQHQPLRLAIHTFILDSTLLLTGCNMCYGMPQPV